MVDVRSADGGRLIESDRAEALRAALPGLSDVDSLAAAMGSARLDVGEVLIREGDLDDHVYILVDGRLRLTVGPAETVLAERGVGAVLGELALLTGRPRSATVTAMEPSTLLTLSREAFEGIRTAAAEFESALIASAERRAERDALSAGLERMLGSDAPESVHALMERADIQRLDRGDVLCRRGDPADGCYVILNGELAVVIDGDDGPAVVRSMGPGETLGELALLLDSPRTATVVARRDARLARITRADFEDIVQRDAQALLTLSRRLAGWLASPRRGADDQHRVVLVRPMGPGPGAREFARTLADDLRRFGPSAFLDGQDARGGGVSANVGPLLDRIFDALRRENNFTVLLADPEDSEWTRRARGASDLLLYVASDDDEPTVEEAEQADQLLKLERWLVRVHPTDAVLPTPSGPWIDAVEPDLHLNVRLGEAEHGERVARLVAGRAVGIALSGGAAKGFGHFGTVLALRDFGIPVDCISGASAGSLAAVLIAQGGDLEARAGERVELLMQKGNPFADVTLPVVAVLRSQRIRKALQRVFEEIRVEDLWLPVRVAVTDLGEGILRSYDRGEAWRLTLASGSPPGLTAPVLIDGRVCCDAGVLDNLPLSLLPARCGARLASMVGGVAGLEVSGAEFPGPWQSLRSVVFGSGAKAPNIGQILLASTVIGSNRNVKATAKQADLFFEPNLDAFGTLDFGAYGGMLEAAREHAAGVLAGSVEAARIRDWAGGAAAG